MMRPRTHDSTKQTGGSCLRLFVAFLCAAGSIAAPHAETDLDAFMKQVLARRDDNWKKLQQYVLDERETIHLQGPGRVPLWGERRDYTWYIRDGFFVRSPVSVNGVAIGEADRRKFEADFLKRQQEREKRGQRGGQVVISGSGIIVEAPDRSPDA